MQLKVCTLIDRLDGFYPSPEQTVRIREGKYLVPDVAVPLGYDVQDPYPTRPVHLCVEIMSPDDRFSDTVLKCGEYHAWGVKYCWIIDPDDKRCWQYNRGGRPDEVPTNGSITAGPIILNHADIFESF